MRGSAGRGRGPWPGVRLVKLGSLMVESRGLYERVLSAESVAFGRVLRSCAALLVVCSACRVRRVSIGDLGCERCCFGSPLRWLGGMM